jgi:hypothetical protein
VRCGDAEGGEAEGGDAEGGEAEVGGAEDGRAEDGEAEDGEPEVGGAEEDEGGGRDSKAASGASEVRRERSKDGSCGNACWDGVSGGTESSVTAAVPLSGTSSTVIASPELVSKGFAPANTSTPNAARWPNTETTRPARKPSSDLCPAPTRYPDQHTGFDGKWSLFLCVPFFVS